jgi:predicted small lipoprotein YifL
MMLRIVLIVGLMSAVTACGTKSALVTPQCSKEEKAENAETAANTEDAINAPSTPSAPSTPATPSKPAPRCGKQVKGQRDPSQPPNPIAR